MIMKNAMALQRINLFRWSKISKVPNERRISGEQNAGFWALLGFAWLSPLMTTGYKRSLERNDIWLVPEARAAAILHEKLEKAFQSRVNSARRFPLAWALYDAFKFDFWLGAVCQLLTSLTQVFAPFTLRYLIKFSKNAYDAVHGGHPNISPAVVEGLGYVIAIAVLQVIQSFALSHFYYRGMLMGGESRSAIIALAFDKSLRLSRRAKAGGGTNNQPEGISFRVDPAGWSNGRIMNLIATDAARVEQACGVLHLAWTSPLQILLTVALLVVNLGYSSLAGVAVLVVGLYVVTKMMKPLTLGREAINKITDRRVSLTQEMLQGIRFVKYFGWESYFSQRLKTIRADETRALRIWHATKSAIGAVSMALPIFSNMTAFIVYSVTAHELEPAVVFSSLALFNGLRTPMNWLPVAIGYIADALTAMERIENFLLAEDAPTPPPPESELQCAVQLHEASFTWENSTEEGKTPKEKPKKPSNENRHSSRIRIVRGRKRHASEKQKETEDPGIQAASLTAPGDGAPFKLENITLELGKCELVGVIGSVGCGKTSLLSALASDMRQTGGSMYFSADRAYCPQYAWIQNASIRDNILFGKPYDAIFYSEVVRACALVPDFEALPSGDLTEIGERGITLSGGQKQRINTARAIYSNAGIVLLDDPLSAVDAHVGKHIFNEAICGLLRDKCRVLATHQLHFLSRCDKIIWMVDGQIAAVGAFKDLMESNPAFANVVTATGPQQREHEEASWTQTEERKTHDRRQHDHRTEAQEQPRQLMQVDVKMVDSVPWAVYVAWMRASGSIFNTIAVLVTVTLFRAANVLTSLWLSWWVSNTYGLSRGQNIAIYAALGVIQGFLLFSFSLVASAVGTAASRTMSNKAVWRILRAPMAFFDTTPLGRIIHRFTKDVDAMDNNLTDSFRQYLIVLTSVLSVFGLIIAYFYYFAIALAVCTIALVLFVSYYRKTARELKRHHAILDGVVFARFSEALMGTSCIRAYGREKQFVSVLHRALDDMDGAYFLTFASQHWLSVRLDIIGSLLSFATGVLVVTNRLSVSPSIAGLLLSYSLSVAGLIQITIKYMAELDNSMCSTERLYQYTNSIEQEPPLVCEPPVRPSWPEQGEIVYEAVQMRYRPDLPLVIDNLSLHIRAGERIGIVGRTGAGKSTILSTLFRLTELAGGRILIDDIDISRIGLHELRSRLAIIPQDPTLFKGTIRSNIDPFKRHTDLELWNVLRQAHLLPQRHAPDIKEAILADGDDEDEETEADDGKDYSNGNESQQRVTLDGKVDEEGQNFSLGQRQLLALARALLRDVRIVLVDEGTSSVDPETDARIQDTLARGLEGKTLIAIAHRLRTVLLYDRICVMDKGSIAELGSPLELWERDGIFRGMCDANGITREEFGAGGIGAGSHV